MHLFLASKRYNFCLCGLAGGWRCPLLAIILLSFSYGAGSKESEDGAQKIAPSQKPEVTAELVEVVQAFIVAGEKNDPG